MWTEAETELETCREALAAAVKAIEGSWGAWDVEIDAGGVVRFKRWPEVQVTGVDLGQRVLAAALAEEGAKKAA